MIKAIGYCRFSSANQRDESIDAQKRAIKYYAAEQGYEIIQFYEDRAKSGKNSQRPAFQQMMSDIKNGDICITAVLVHKLDRFSRDLADSLFYQQQLQDSNIELVSVMERLDASPTGNLMKTIIGAINSFYVENLASETMKGLKENAYNCITTGGTPPLGYDLVDKKYIINPKEAEAVKLAFTMYDEGHGYLPIIRRLNLLGYTTKTGRNFSKSGLYEIFRNERYKGCYTYNKAQKRRRDGSRSGESKPDDQIIRIEGGVPTIVDSDVWDRVNAMMDKRKKAPGSAKAKHTYLLSGLIYCGECGYSMHGNARKPAPDRDVLITYRCGHRSNHSSEACQNREIKRDVIEGFVLTQLERYFFNDDIIPTLTKELNSYINTSNVENNRLNTCLTERHSELERQKANIIDAIKKTGFQNIFSGQLSGIEQELAEIRSQLERSTKALDRVTITEDMVRGYLSQFKRFVKERDIPQIKVFIDSYVERVEIFQTHIKVTFRVAFSFMKQAQRDDAYNFNVQISRRQLRERISA